MLRALGALLGQVVGVVAPDAHDLAREREGRQGIDVRHQLWVAELGARAGRGECRLVAALGQGQVEAAVECGDAADEQAGSL